ncbi:hypothetical protein ANHYDRO_01094 [Anaerococcus hydrogenalis DSM 7454]|uniref:Uncharacterized protein n=1 Tax=Anaerococcus hydrogenalis DSM 7454 TaxID=561177 RepID=B6W943_9FIRM|nr:hypothetical protein ANHYDRO_01094 [Anaerococcus hydrogenalis DSM 7454]
MFAKHQVYFIIKKFLKKLEKIKYRVLIQPYPIFCIIFIF